MPTPARLEVVAGNAAGTWLEVGDELLLGRHADGVGRLGDEQEISRYHARISVDPDGTCAIEDLGSTNGTLVNGVRITASQRLSVGDTIQLGGTTLAVRELPQSAAAAAAPPPLSLRLDVDMASGEARIFLGTAEDPVRVVFDAGSWRIAPTG